MKTEKKNAIIIGAGTAGKQLLDEINKHKGYNIVGFLDDNPHKKGDIIEDIRVIGTTENIKKIIKENNIKECFIAIPTASGREMQNIVEKCKKENLDYKIIPRLSEIIDGTVNIQHLRSPKSSDFLGRARVRKDLEEVKKDLKGKSILITGAGGSIGSGLVSTLLRLGIDDIICLDNSEYGIFHLKQKYEKTNKIRYRIASIQDIISMEHIFIKDKPDIIFHAAAYKHVTLMEENVESAIINNIFGTKNVIELCYKYNIDRFVMISTDKAVNPTSIMGVTKRICEKIIEVYADKTGNKTKDNKTLFSGVRFGNVLGSSGSVIPIFKKQIMSKREVTVTHKDVERYFMTIPEATELVIQSSTLGENGEILILDMGMPIKILDLAKNIIQAYGLEPEKDVKIKFIGLRNGEKLTEELLLKTKDNIATKYEKIYIIKKEESFDNKEFMKTLDTLKVEIMKANTDKIKMLSLLKKLAPNFNHMIYEGY